VGWVSRLVSIQSLLFLPKEKEKRKKVEEKKEKKSKEGRKETHTWGVC
jgi:hypothetical protein